MSQHTEPRPSRARTAAITITIIGAIALAFVAFWPTPVDRGAHETINSFLGWAHTNGAPAALDYGFIEFTANIVMFVPVGALALIVLGTRRWLIAALTGLSISLVVELGQGLFLAERVSSLSDIVANTAGDLIGVGLGLLVLKRAGRRSNVRQEEKT